MTDIKSAAGEARAFIVTFIKWLMLAALMGGICGGVGVLFHKSVEWVTAFRISHEYIIFALPAAGALIVLLYRALKTDSSIGTNSVFSSIRSHEKIPFVLAPLIFVSTVISHLFGASVGREGAALQMGGSLGAWLGRRFHFDVKDIRMLILCGMSSAFAALFGTPLTATFFAIEVISIGVFYYSALIPCVVSSVTAYGIAVYFGIKPVAFDVAIPGVDALTVVRVIVLAALCAVLSIAYCIIMKQTHKLLAKYLKNEYLRIIIISTAVAGISFFIGTRYNGAGMDVITNAVGGNAEWYDFIMKMLLSALCIGAGFKGGEIVPTLFIGATFGCVVAPLIGLSPAFGAAVGLVTLFCSAVNAPVASIILSIELFGTGNILLFAIACCVGYMLSGYYGLYSSQKIIYSKLSVEFIDKTVE